MSTKNRKSISNSIKRPIISSPNNKIDIIIRSFLLKLSTGVGIAVAIFTLIGMGFTIGVYYSNFENNQKIYLIQEEMIKQSKEFNTQISSLKNEIQILEIENEKLKGLNISLEREIELNREKK